MVWRQGSEVELLVRRRRGGEILVCLDLRAQEWRQRSKVKRMTGESLEDDQILGRGQLRYHLRYLRVGLVCLVCHGVVCEEQDWLGLLESVQNDMEPRVGAGSYP